MSETTINQPAKMISIKELFKLSLAVYPTVFWKTIKMLLLPLVAFIPVGILAILIVLVEDASPAAGMSNFLYVILGLLGTVATIFFLIVMYIAQIGAMIIVQKNDPQILIKDTFLLAKSKAWKFLTTSLWAGLFVFLWMLLLIIPGLVMMVYYTFIAWMVLEEGLSGKAALKRSKGLVKDYWWAVFWRIVLPAIVIGIVFGTLGAKLLPPTTPGVPTPYTPGRAAYDFLTQIISWVITPFFVAYSYNMYKSLKAINDKQI